MPSYLLSISKIARNKLIEQGRKFLKWRIFLFTFKEVGIGAKEKGICTLKLLPLYAFCD